MGSCRMVRISEPGCASQWCMRCGVVEAPILTSHTHTHPSKPAKQLHCLLSVCLYTHSYDFLCSAVHRSIHASTYVFVCPFIHPSIISVIPSLMHLSIHSSIHPSVQSFIHPSIQCFPHPVFHPTIHLFICPFILPSTHPFKKSFLAFIHSLSYDCRHLCIFLLHR